MVLENTHEYFSVDDAPVKVLTYSFKINILNNNMFFCLLECALLWAGIETVTYWPLLMTRLGSSSCGMLTHIKHHNLIVVSGETTTNIYL